MVRRLGRKWQTLHRLVYLICLVKAFESADFSVAYPVMRGIAPVLASAAAIGVFGERLQLEDTEGKPDVGLAKARKLISLYQKKSVPRERILIKTGIWPRKLFANVWKFGRVMARPVFFSSEFNSSGENQSTSWSG